MGDGYLYFVSGQKARYSNPGRFYPGGTVNETALSEHSGSRLPKHQYYAGFCKRK
jgi:hypothetical protein